MRPRTPRRSPLALIVALLALLVATGTAVANPSLDFVTQPDAVSASSSADFVWTSDDPDATFTCSLNGAAPFTCNHAFNVEGLAEGPYGFDVTATDTGGDETSIHASWFVDVAAPDSGVSLTPTATGTVYDATSNEDEAVFECSLDGAAFAPCAAHDELSGLDVGDHTLAVRAVDLAGLVDDTPATAPFTVSAPEVPESHPRDTVGPRVHVNPQRCDVEWLRQGCRFYRKTLRAWRHLAGGTVTDPSPGSGVARVQVNVVIGRKGHCDAWTGSAWKRMECGHARTVWLHTTFSAHHWNGIALRDLHRGKLVVRARATDKAGNTGPVARRATRIRY